MLRNASRTEYFSLALSQEQGIVLKLFLVRNRGRLLGSQRYTPTLKFGSAPPGTVDTGGLSILHQNNMFQFLV